MDTAVITKFAGLLIPITALLLPIFIVGIALYFKQRQREALYETVKHFADRGMPVPRELLDPPRFRAITLIGVGIGLALLFGLCCAAWWLTDGAALEA